MGRRIAIAGIRGSFSEGAALAHLGATPSELRYAVTPSRAIMMVATRYATHGIVPLQNSLGGMVRDTVQTLARYECQVETMLPVRVEQSLLVRLGVTIDEITAVVSHPQALAQCQGYLDRALPTVVRQRYADTALAARDLAQGKLPPTTAVLAPARAAVIYGLTVVAEAIQDSATNTTTFLLIRPPVRKVTAPRSATIAVWPR
ncbi:hypothetical protein HY374_04165 [Candidatus Berkelbacteria bacterium]|nr:hypothetical protein [Candidatus Berkelbacteria bacterium]